MEGEGQEISLESPIDINSNDQMVSIGQSQFSFNRQRYLGSLLQTSVRYEADGWFAGWWGHTFDLVKLGDSRIEPPIGSNANLNIFNRKYTIEGFEYNVVQQKDAGLEFHFVLEPQIQVTVGTGVTVTRLNDTQVRVTGVTDKGTAFDVTVNAYDGTIISSNLVSPMTVTCAKVGENFSFNVFRDGIEESITLRWNKQLEMLGSAVSYSRNAFTSTFGSYFELDDDHSVRSLLPSISVIGVQTIDLGLETEHELIDTKDVTIYTVTGNAVVLNKWFKNKFTNAQANNLADGYIDISTKVGVPGDMVLQNPTTRHKVVKRENVDGSTMRTDSRIDVEYQIPIWLQNKSEWDYKLIDTVKDTCTVTVVTDPSTGDVTTTVVFNGPFKDLCSIETVDDVKYIRWADRTWEPVPLTSGTIEHSYPSALTFGWLTDLQNLADINNGVEGVDYKWEWSLVTTEKRTTKIKNPVPPPNPLPVPPAPPYEEFIFNTITKYYDSNGILQDTLPADVWLDKDSQYLVPVTNGGNDPAVTPTQPNTTIITEPYTEAVDSSWVLKVRCVNLNPDMPVGLTDYFTLTRSCSGNFTTINDNLLTLSTMQNNIRSVDPYHEVLNEIPWTDPNIQNWNNGTITFNVPECVPAISIVRIEDYDLNKENKDAFTYTIIPNSYYNLKAYRFDDNAGEFGLNVLDAAELGAVQVQGSQESGILDTTGLLHQINVKWAQKKQLIIPIGPVTQYPYWIAGLPETQIKFPTAISDVFVYFTVQKAEQLSTISGPVAADIENDFTRQKIESMHVTFNCLPAVQGKQQIVFKLTSTETIDLEYDIDTKQIITKNVNLVDYELVEPIAYADSKLIIKLRQTAIMQYELWRTFILDKTAEFSACDIVSQNENGLLTFTVGYGTVNKQTQQSQNMALLDVIGYESNNYILKIKAQIQNKAEVLFIPDGIYYWNIGQLEYISKTLVGQLWQIRFRYNGVEHILYYDTNSKQELRYNVTDIRNGEVKELYRRDIKDIQLYIKQFWSNDTHIENYWWVDEKHVLELSKYYMTLYRKWQPGDAGPDVHDWMGDNWFIEQRTQRGNWITSDDLKYGCSCAYMVSGVFYKLQVTASAIVVKVCWDINNVNFDNPTWQTAVVPVKQVAFGNKLATDAISAYTQLTPSLIVQQSHVSSTCVAGNKFMLGFASTRGLRQWTLLFNQARGETLNLLNVITGFGHVGVEGQLTGAAIPAMCCDKNGFNATVYSIADLPAEGNGQPPNKCYGTGDTVWFCYNLVPSVVLYLAWNGLYHVVVPVALNNNTASQYESESFYANRFLDIAPIALGIKDFFKLFDDGTNNPFFTVLDAIISIIDVVIPDIWLLNPQYLMAAYINHSYGLYSYVYTNSSKIAQKPGKGDIELYFSKAQRSVMLYSFGLENLLVQVLVKGLLGFTAEPISYNVNEAQSQSAVTDTEGRKWGEFFVENVATTIGTSLLSSGITMSIKSTIGIKFSLGMFYSIDNGMTSYAGDGFVNHSFTGQCVAQSVSDLQVDFKRMGYWAALQALTNFMLSFQWDILRITIHAIQTGNTVLPGEDLDIPVGPYAVITARIGGLLAIIGSAALPALELLSVMYEKAGTVLNAVMTYLGMDVVCYFSGGLARRTLDIEGEHRYGDKPIAFHWPCFNAPAICYTDEQVQSTYIEEKQQIELGPKLIGVPLSTKEAWTINSNSGLIYNPLKYFSGILYSVKIMCKSQKTSVTAPADTAVVEGITSMLDNGPMRNEQVGMPWPVVQTPVIQDYIINKRWNLAVTAVGGEVFSYTADDTKLMDGPASNIVITDTFCGLASSYIALEIKDLYEEKYLRPWAATGNTIALNINRMNCVHDAKVYHAFDGYSNRITQWTGDAGLDKCKQWLLYTIQSNDHFKRSNIFPPSHFRGGFMGPPSQALRTYDPIHNLVVDTTNPESGAVVIPGELKDLARFALPVHCEPLATLPAIMRILGPYRLFNADGITSLTTMIRSGNTAYKAPSSIDFAIGQDMFRATEEYVGSVKTTQGLVDFQPQTPVAGLEFIGATTKEAFFYSPATRMYYTYSGGGEISKKEIFNRFKDIQAGRWDYVNQEIIFKCIATGNLIEESTMLLRLEGNVVGELYPPPRTIWNDRSGFKFYSCFGGPTCQGPRRFTVSRFIINEHMYPEIIMNKAKPWRKVSRENFYDERDYGWLYEDFYTVAPIGAVYGWTHNPFKVATAMLGQSEDQDCKFEWQLNWAWTEQMNKLFAQNEYVWVNVQTETITQGGLVISEVTHVPLYKECFTRSRNGAGYYTFIYQGNNGAGNRERIYIWSDGIIALEQLKIYCKGLTQRRTQPLHTQVDVLEMNEQ